MFMWVLFFSMSFICVTTHIFLTRETKGQILKESCRDCAGKNDTNLMLRDSDLGMSILIVENQHLQEDKNVAQVNHPSEEKTPLMPNGERAQDDKFLAENTANYGATEK